MEFEKGFMKVEVTCSKGVGPFKKMIINTGIKSMLRVLTELELIEDITEISIKKATEEDVDEAILKETREKSND